MNLVSKSTVYTFPRQKIKTEFEKFDYNHMSYLKYFRTSSATHFLPFEKVARPEAEHFLVFLQTHISNNFQNNLHHLPNAKCFLNCLDCVMLDPENKGQ